MSIGLGVIYDRTSTWRFGPGIALETVLVPVSGNKYLETQLQLLHNRPTSEEKKKSAVSFPNALCQKVQ